MKFRSPSSRRDLESIQEFSRVRQALAGEKLAPTSRLGRLGAGIVHFAETARATVAQTIQEGRMADEELRLANARQHLEEGHLTSDEIADLANAGQGVIVYPFKR